MLCKLYYWIFCSDRCFRKYVVEDASTPAGFFKVRKWYDNVVEMKEYQKMAEEAVSGIPPDADQEK